MDGDETSSIISFMVDKEMYSTVLLFKDNAGDIEKQLDLCLRLFHRPG